MIAANVLLQIMLGLSLAQVTLQIVLNTVQGKIRGIQQDGYVSYIGIPYASISSYAGRFKAAGLAPVWSGIREPRDPHCSATSAVEDCLQLDVHVPNSGSQMPVLFWVKGSSGYYHPGKLVSQGIIVMIVRHRLGPLGFLCSKTDKIPGNAGVKDILQALRWTRDNIVAFNGSPHKVIIAGQSFGAAMVEALMLLPASRDLYHGAILQSGSILCPWTFNYDAEDRASALRKMIGSEDLAQSVVKVDSVTLKTKAEELDFPYMPFGLCVEKPYKNEEGVILESPLTSFLKGKLMAVPLLMGYNTNEAYIFASLLKTTRVTSKAPRDMKFLIPEELQSLNERELMQISNLVKDMYFNDTIDMNRILLYHRDAYFLSHIHRSLRFHAATHQPVYYYQFSHYGNAGVETEPGVKKIGAAHSDELAYLFPNGGDLDNEDGIVQQHLIELWTNFVKHLNPTPDNSPTKWEPTDPHHPRLLDINTDLEMKEFTHTRAAQMWKNIYERYYYSRKLNMAAK